MYLWNIGAIEVPYDIKKIFSLDGKFLISPTLGQDYFFEMSGESMYYALVDIEKTHGLDMSVYKKRIIDAVLERIHYCNGKLYHNNLTGSGLDTQLRSSSSAIRILIEAIKDGFDNYVTLSNLINYHFQFLFQWSNGIWFCHDTSEYYGRGPKSHIKTRILKKTPNNTLTLNTHFDSLSTLLLLTQYKNRLDLNFSIDQYIYYAFNSMRFLLSSTHSKSHINVYLQKIDCKLLNYNIVRNNLFSKVYERIIHPVLFKIFSPTIFFNNGFIGRDFAVLNRHLDYHIVNLVDIARVLCLLKDYEYWVNYYDVYNSYIHVLEEGVNLGKQVPNFNKYILRGELNIAWICELSTLLLPLNIKNPYCIDHYKYPQYNPFIQKHGR